MLAFCAVVMSELFRHWLKKSVLDLRCSWCRLKQWWCCSWCWQSFTFLFTCFTINQIQYKHTIRKSRTFSPLFHLVTLELQPLLVTVSTSQRIEKWLSTAPLVNWILSSSKESAKTANPAVVFSAPSHCTSRNSSSTANASPTTNRVQPFPPPTRRNSPKTSFKFILRNTVLGTRLVSS